MNTLKKIMWGLAVLILLGTAAVIRFLPDTVPMHMDFEGNIDRWGSKYENLIFPVVIFGLALFMHLFIRHFEKVAAKAKEEKVQKEALSNAKVLGIIGIATMVAEGIVQGCMLYADYVSSPMDQKITGIDLGKAACILMGVFFLVLGNYMPKTRKNGIVGLRVSWSMYNDVTWSKSNRFGGILIMIEGVVAILAGLLFPSSFAAVMVTLGFGCFVTIASVLYAHRVYTDEIRTEEKRAEKTNEEKETEGEA